MNEFYRSSNGDSWLLYHDIQSGGLLVRHEANAASGGYTTDVDILVAVAAADQPIIFTLIRDSGQAEGTSRLAANRRTWNATGPYGLSCVNQDGSHPNAGLRLENQIKALLFSKHPAGTATARLLSPNINRF